MADQPYQYRGSGLDDVYLANGFEKKKRHTVRPLTIQDVPGLHRAIGQSIISDTKPISARELRYLRKNMDLTQEELATRFRVDVQTVARYEKEQTAIPGAIDRLMRIMFTLHTAPPQEREEIIERVRAIVEDQLSQSDPSHR